jgi:glycosyltransferase involved in cell wall biosynthesis
MKILLANKYFHPVGGPETLLFNSMEKLKSLGHEVIPFSVWHPGNVKTEFERYFVSPVDYNNHSSLPWNLAKTTLRIIYNPEAKKKMEQLIEETHPDIAHLHNIYHQLSPSILLPLRKHNIPILMTLHDFKLVCPNYTFLRDGQVCEECEGKHFYKAIKYRCVKDSYLKSSVSAVEMYLHKFFRIYESCVDRFIVLSQFSKERFIRYGLSEEQLIFLPNPIEISSFPKNEGKDRYILFFGRLSEKNGILTLIKAMKQLPEIKLSVLGEGEQKDLILDYIRENGLKNVKLLGFKEGSELKRLIEECYFTVFPNHYYHLCPMSILESFTFGKPVIGSNLGSVPELVEDGVTGLLFEPRNEKDLADKIKLLYRNPDLVEKLGHSARLKVEESYSAEKYYPRLLQIYEELVQKRKMEESPCLVTGTDAKAKEMDTKLTLSPVGRA